MLSGKLQVVASVGNGFLARRRACTRGPGTARTAYPRYFLHGTVHETAYARLKAVRLSEAKLLLPVADIVEFERRSGSHRIVEVTCSSRRTNQP